MNPALMAPFGRAPNGKRARWRRRPARSLATGRREPELWERAAEPYPAATVLEDLLAVVGDADAAQRIVARFAATRMVLLVLHGGINEEELAEERAVARLYVEALPHGDAERRVLGRLLALTRSRVRRAVGTCANEAGELAGSFDHDAGAFWLHYVAYTAGRAFGWPEESLRAARAIEGAATARGAVHSQRLWRGRVAALEIAND